MCYYMLECPAQWECGHQGLDTAWFVCSKGRAAGGKHCEDAKKISKPDNIDTTKRNGKCPKCLEEESKETNIDW
jgi:hypothetical protein